jgi:hypothetical protein
MSFLKSLTLQKHEQPNLIGRDGIPMDFLKRMPLQCPRFLGKVSKFLGMEVLGNS